MVSSRLDPNADDALGEGYASNSNTWLVLVEQQAMAVGMVVIVSYLGPLLGKPIPPRLQSQPPS